MDSMDYWRLCDSVSVFQATMLICGFDPANCAFGYVEDKEDGRQPEGYEAIKTAIVNAIIEGKIKTVKYEPISYQDDTGSWEVEQRSVDIVDTIVSVSEIKNFLSRKGIKTGFFFPEGAETDEFLDPNHEHYAPKLAAVVKAWKTVTDTPELLNGKTPKQAITKWLRENAAQYGLTDDEGKPSEGVINDIAKIANWRPEGGAAKTPTQVTKNPTPLKESVEDQWDDDTEIPF